MFGDLNDYLHSSQSKYSSIFLFGDSSWTEGGEGEGATFVEAVEPVISFIEEPRTEIAPEGAARSGNPLARPWWTGGVLVVDGVADGAEAVGGFATEEGHRPDADNGDQRDQKGVLDQ